MKPPETIRSIITQAGGFGLHGAFGYVGARDFIYKCAQPTGEFRSSYPSRWEAGRVDFEVGLQFRVNGRPGKAWTMLIAYEPDDTYTVWLFEPNARVLAEHRNVHCDELQGMVEQTYDRAIVDHNQGFIPLH